MQSLFRYSASVGIQQLFVNTAAPFDEKRTLLRNLDAGLKSLCDAPDQADILFLMHDCRILRQSFNPVLCFSMMEQVR